MAKERVFTIAELELPEDIYTRARGRPWWANVHTYAQEMLAGAKFPPIMVGEYEGRLIVVDGYHRVSACKELKIEYINGTIKKYTSIGDIIKDSVEANNHHGVRYTAQDKAHIAQLLEMYGIEQQQISELIRVPVEKLTRFTVRNFGGKTIKEPLMKLVEKGLITLEQAAEMDQSRVSTQSVEDVVVQFIGYLRFGMYPWSEAKYIGYATTIMRLLTEGFELTGLTHSA